MKYGVLINTRTDNIGDDIQSFAECRFLPSVDYVVDRESLDTFGIGTVTEQVSVIMNSWYMYNKSNWPPSPMINPLFVAVHFSTNDYLGIGDRFLDSIGGEYLKHYGPIGARDQHTLELLSRKGIDSYFSGCLTLTLDLPDITEKTEDVYLVDVGEEDKKTISRLFPSQQWTELTHAVDPNEYKKISWEERYHKVEELLTKYKRAKCVVTSRMHCALPCLALGTPVILIYKQENLDRFQSFLPLLHSMESGNLDQMKEYFDVTNPPENSKDYLSIRTELENKCKEFISDAEQGNVMPCFDVSLEEKYLWQKQLMQESDIAIRNTVELRGFMNWKWAKIIFVSS